MRIRTWDKDGDEDKSKGYSGSIEGSTVLLGQFVSTILWFAFQLFKNCNFIYDHSMDCSSKAKK